MEFDEKQKNWITQLEELWNLLDSRLKGYKLNSDDLRLIVLLYMTVAVHRLIRGILAQLKGGSNDNLDSKLRTLTEATINIKYILADETGNRAKAFILDSKKSQRKTLDKIIGLLEQDKTPAMAQVNALESYKERKLSMEQEIAEQENLLGKDNVRWPSIEQRAKEVNDEEMYATVFWNFSADTHMTAQSLMRFLTEVDGGAAFTTEPDLSTLTQEIQTAFMFYLHFINTCSQELSFLTEKELKEFNNSEMLPKGAS